MKKRHNWGLPLLTALVTLGIWEGAVRLFDISLYILPAPSDVLMAVIENFQELMYHASVTLSEALIGLGLSALLAIILAILMDLSRTFKRCIFPHLVVTQTVPVRNEEKMESIMLRLAGRQPVRLRLCRR